MRVKYRCAVEGFVRLEFSFPIKSDLFTYDFETDSEGKLTHISAIASVPDKSMWPTIEPSSTQGITAHLNFTSPFHSIARKDLRTAEGILSLIGLKSIDFDNVEQSWLPDSPEEKRELHLHGLSRSTKQLPVSEWPIAAFNLVASAFLAAKSGRDIETALSFFRKGRLDVMASRYIEAVYDFLFMIESLYSSGKFKTAQVEEEYLKSPELQHLIAKAMSDPLVLHNISSDARMKGAFARDYSGKSPAEVTRHIVNLRGFLHHHTSSRPDIWHPDDHVRYGADAYFLQQLCCDIGFSISTPIWFADTLAADYQEQLSNATKANQINIVQAKSK